MCWFSRTSFSYSVVVLCVGSLIALSGRAGEFDDAIEKGDLAKVQALLKDSPKLAELGTPLHLAARLGQVEIADYLLSHGAKVDSQGWGMTRLTFDPTGARVTPLHHAAAYGQVAMIELLVKRKADVDARDTQGSSPLHYATKFGQAEAVATLIASKGKIAGKDIYGRTPLHWAGIVGDTKVLETLLDKGADVRSQDEFGWTPLHYAAQHGRIDAIPLLIKAKADVNRADRNGATPLHACADGRRFSTNEIVGVKGKQKHTIELRYMPLTENRVKAAELLIAAGAKVKTADSQRVTPLHLAARGWQIKLVRLLLDKGADPQAKDSVGNAPTANLAYPDRQFGPDGANFSAIIQTTFLPRANGSPGDVGAEGDNSAGEVVEINALLAGPHKR